MIYKLKLDILEKVIPSLITDPNEQKMAMTILTGRRSNMGFQKACFKFDAITGEDISGMVEAYEDSIEAKKAEAEEFAE